MYKNQASNIVYSIRVPVFGTDIEYCWRMSPLNIPNTIYLSAEEVK